VCRRPGRSKRLANPAQLLADDAVTDLVEPGAAIGLRITHAEQSELGPFAEQFAGKDLGFLGLHNQRRNFLGDEPGDGLTHLLVLGRELEIHPAVPLGGEYSPHVCMTCARDFDVIRSTHLSY
jgi:hypothetical protein